MLLTITTTYRPATDLGFLLSKHPDRCQSFRLNYGQVHVFYPEATDSRCSASLLVDIDPIGLVRGRRGGGNGTLTQYVNDRPYVSSSFLSVAIAQVYGSALNGKSRERPELADTPIDLVSELPVVPCRGGERVLRALFEPLGYSVQATRIPLDERFPEWGTSPYFGVTLENRLRLQDLLSHLYVLLPVLDDEKHYYVGEDEIQKLLAKGEQWLAKHPERDQIAERYLKHSRRLTRLAIAQLVAEDEVDLDAADEEKEHEEAQLERNLSLNEQRINAVLAALRSARARSVLDLGCGEGKLLRALFADQAFRRIVGVDVSHRALEIAARRLHLADMPARRRERIDLLQGALTYRDDRLAGFDAACLIEVIEHIDASRIGALERVLFEFARPGTVIITTPNVEYNKRFDNLPAGRLRHRDHRFEWTRAQFESWASRVAEQHGYAVRFLPVGDVDPEVGAPTQMGVLSR